MAKIQIRVGPKGRKVDVNAWPFLPGLYAHCDYGSGDESMYTVTHVASHLCVIKGIEESKLELVRSVLGKLLWDLPAKTIYKDNRYYRAIREAKSVLTNQQRSDRQEERISKDVKGKRQPASGSRWGYKRDIVTPVFLIEAKTTKSKSFSIAFKDLAFIRKQAYSTGKVPVYLISLMDSCEVAVLPDQDVGIEDVPKGCITKTVSYQSSTKSLPINLELVKFCTGGGLVNVQHGKSAYIVMGYETFLQFAKKGVE